MVSPIRFYIGVDGVQYRQLAKVRKVTLFRAEGPTALCDSKPRVYEGENALRDAHRQLAYNAATAPKNGGYDKHDFSIEWTTGDQYNGRYDLVHSSLGLPDLLQHVRGSLQFVTGDSERLKTLEKFSPPTFAANRKIAKTMLARCDVGQRPQPIPAHWQGRPGLFLVRDYTKQPLSPAEV